MKKLDIMFMYLGFFEEMWDLDPDEMQEDNWDNYLSVLAELNKISDKHYHSTYVRAIEEKRNELPWSKQ